MSKETPTDLVEQIRAALGLTKETRESHARHNLDGALIDMLSHQGRASWPVVDEICERTIRRVMGQLAEVEKILESAHVE